MQVKYDFEIQSMNVFKEYPGIGGTNYRAIRLKDREIALFEEGGKTFVYLCSAYNEEKDKKATCRGAGWVKKEWIARSNNEILNIVNKHCLDKLPE